MLLYDSDNMEDSDKKLFASTSLPLQKHEIPPPTRQASLPVSPVKLLKKPPPLLRLNSDPKILPSTEESRQLEAFSGVTDQNHENGILKLRSQLESGSVKCGQFQDANPTTAVANSTSNSNQKSAKNRSEQVKMLVKQKSLGRTLSTSVLRIKKKRSFWSNEKFKQ